MPSPHRIASVLLVLQLFTGVVLAKTKHYRCMWREDPSTSMVVGWSQWGGKRPMLYLDTVSHAETDSPEDYAQSFAPSNKVWYKGMHNHFARLRGLRPNTVYYFRIADSNSTSVEMSFRTLPDDNSPLSIIAGGDSRNHRKYRQNANMLVAKLRPHFVMFGGDMTGSDGSKSWQKWMDDWQLTIAADGRVTPIVAARGNHERSNRVIQSLFDVPHKDIYYALTFGESLLRAYTLNSLIATGGKQRQWLENDLKTHTDVKWKFAHYHYPMRPHTSKKTERYTQQENWAPLFLEHGVDLVVECDAHVVKSTYPIRPSKEAGHDEGFIRDDENGTVYVGEGCWGAPRRQNNDDKKWTRASGSFNQFKWIFVRMDGVEVRTVKTDNAATVGELGDGDRFQLPSNVDIWKPETGAVIALAPRGARGKMSVNEKPRHHSPKPLNTNGVPAAIPSEYADETLTEQNGRGFKWLVVFCFFLPLILAMVAPLFVWPER